MRYRGPISIFFVCFCFVYVLGQRKGNIKSHMWLYQCMQACKCSLHIALHSHFGYKGGKAKIIFLALEATNESFYKLSNYTPDIYHQYEELLILLLFDLMTF